MKDAKGHGSDARGGASHQDAVNRLGRSPLSQQALDVIRKNPGGFSTTLNGETPTSGHMVAVPGRSTVIQGLPTESHIDEYARRNADVLSQPGAHIGGWHNEGKTYLDVSHNIHDREQAVAAGRQRNQIAIWDVKHGREIPTGGTGK